MCRGLGEYFVLSLFDFTPCLPLKDDFCSQLSKNCLERSYRVLQFEVQVLQMQVGGNVLHSTNMQLLGCLF